MNSEVSEQTYGLIWFCETRWWLAQRNLFKHIGTKFVHEIGWDE